MYKNFYLLVFGLTFSAANIFAQDTLPDFTVKNLNGRITISWFNNYVKEVKAISIQRSYDSIRNFSTFASVPNPKNTKNGFIDKNAPYDKMFYRLFIVFDSGGYVYSRSGKPGTGIKLFTAEAPSDSAKHVEDIQKNKKREVTIDKKEPKRESKNEKQEDQPVEKIIKKEIPVIPK